MSLHNSSGYNYDSSFDQDELVASKAWAERESGLR